jgi:hypothetical protein
MPDSDTWQAGMHVRTLIKESRYAVRTLIKEGRYAVCTHTSRRAEVGCKKGRGRVQGQR